LEYLLTQAGDEEGVVSTRLHADNTLDLSGLRFYAIVSQTDADCQEKEREEPECRYSRAWSEL